MPDLKKPLFGATSIALCLILTKLWLHLW